MNGGAERCRLRSLTGADSVSERRVRDHLSELNRPGLIDIYERNEGLTAGRYTKYELDVQLAAVLDVLLSIDRFDELAGIIQSAAEDHGSLQSEHSNH